MLNNLSDIHILHFNRSSLIYNTSARHERHECDTNATLATRVRHECYTNDTSKKQVKKFEKFSQPYIYCVAGERLQEEEQFHSKN